MASTINGTSTGSGGLISTGDDSGILNIQTNETTAITVDASQRAAFVAGTAALPAITTTGDTNTGIFFPAADTIAFSEGGAESMRIDSSGNVGIGATPNSKLYVRAATNANLRVTDSSGTLNLSAENDAGSAQVAMKFNGSQMMLDASGNVLVSTARSSARALVDIPTSGGSAGVPLAVSRGGDGGTMVNFYSMSSTTTVIGSIGNSSNTNTTYNTSSDYRLKDEVTPMSGGLDKVSALKPVTWKWKSTGEDGQGFIAHELAEVILDCVTGAKDAVDADGNPVYQGVDTSYLVATLTAALQETKALIDTQAETINALTARIVALEGQ